MQSQVVADESFAYERSDHSLKLKTTIQIGKVMCLYKNDLLPDSFNDMFLLNCDVHSYNTRSKNSFRLPYCRTNVRKFSLRFQGPKIFNSLSFEI